MKAGARSKEKQNREITPECAPVIQRWGLTPDAEERGSENTLSDWYISKPQSLSSVSACGISVHNS